MEEGKKRGRPFGTTKQALAQREKGLGIETSLKKVIPDEDERATIISSLMEHACQMYKNAPVVSNEDCYNRIINYFDYCREKGSLPTVEGLALTLGVTYTTLGNWARNSNDPERQRMIQQAKQLIAELDAQLVLQNKIPSMPYIFRAKNFYQMTDKTDVNLNATQSLLTDIDEEALKETIDKTIVDSDFDDN